MRRDNDFYPTPAASVRELLNEIAPEVAPGTVLDPAAGDGALLRAARCVFGSDMLYQGFDISLPPSALAEPIAERDYLDTVMAIRGVPISLYLSNPPYSLAQEFVTKTLAERGPNTIVCALLRLNFLGSQKRENWWRGLQRPALRRRLRRALTRYSRAELGLRTRARFQRAWRSVPSGSIPVYSYRRLSARHRRA